MRERQGPGLLAVACPACGRPAGSPCSDDVSPGQVHKWRKKAAVAAGLTPSKPECTCRNHMGGHKVQHRSEAAALAWIVRHRSDGMRYETYRCPSSDKWHVRTARAPRSEQQGRAV